MTCTLPPPPEPAALLRVMSGEGEPEVTAHLAACPACMAHAEALAREERRLTGALFRAGCPSSEELADYADGAPDPERRSAVARHVTGCPLCRRDLAEYSAFMALPDAIPESAVAPESASIPARAVTPDGATAPGVTRSPDGSRSSRLGDLIEGLTVLVAQAVGGAGGLGGLTPALAGAGAASGGLRGSAAGEAVFAVDAADVRITLKVAPDEERRGRRILSGTLSGPAREGVTVWLATDDRVIAGTTVGARGYFELAGLAPDRYTLTLCLPHVAVQIPALEL